MDVLNKSENLDSCSQNDLALCLWGVVYCLYMGTSADISKWRRELGKTIGKSGRQPHQRADSNKL
jgi:hypothetical protein